MSLLPDSPPVQPVSTQPMLLDQELVRLGRNATFNLIFPPPLEQQFRDWLQEKAMRFLRQYIWILAGLYVLLVLATVPKIYLFTDLNAYPGDELVYWAMVGALGVVTVVFAFFVSQPKFD
ncbi:MAG: hypothetical protein Q8J78_12235, partial [Moraxellaceae bacterium]|nr:hypothetical protein [Moraxellaceae bacterium]